MYFVQQLIEILKSRFDTRFTRGKTVDLTFENCYQQECRALGAAACMVFAPDLAT